MFACITLGAFNDNYFKSALMILLTYKLASTISVDINILLYVAAAFFILPFFLCSGLAGELADAMPKHKLVRILKLTEAVLMMAAAVALLAEQTWILMGILFLVGVQAAFFGPTKYAILPQLVVREELLLGNGLVEGGTFLFILLGTTLGGLFILRPHGIEGVAATLVIIGLLGMYAAWRVPETPTSNAALKINYNIFVSTWRMLLTRLSQPADFGADPWHLLVLGDWRDLYHGAAGVQ